MRTRSRPASRRRQIFRARTSDDFRADTVNWMLINSEDVGDAVTMLSIAMLVGFGVTGVMMFMFTNENLKYYAVLSAMGASTRSLLTMIVRRPHSARSWGRAWGSASALLPVGSLRARLPVPHDVVRASRGRDSGLARQHRGRSAFSRAVRAEDAAGLVPGGKMSGQP